MAPLIQSPVFASGTNPRQRARDRLQQLVNERGITIRNRDGSRVDVDELLDGIFDPEPQAPKAVIVIAIGLLCMLAAWIAFVLAYRPG